MEFRWIVFLTLWTTLSGPMFVRPVESGRAAGLAPAVLIAPAVPTKTAGTSPAARRLRDTCRQGPVAYP